MICPHCGEDNPDNAKYCVRCSATLRKKDRLDTAIVIIIIVVAALLVGGIFVFRSVIGKGGKIPAQAENPAEENTEEAEADTTDTSAEETAEESTEEAEAEHSDWFSDHGLTFSDASEKFKFKTMKNDGENDTDEMDVSGKITISESHENVSEGYKILTAVFEYDISGSDGARGVISDGVFDGYTGTYYGFENEQPEQDDDNKAEYEGFVRITDDSFQYDIAVKTDQEFNAPTLTKTITLVCPSDYEGAVFYSGYGSLEYDAKREALDMGERLYTFDELPYMNNESEEDDEQRIFYYKGVKADSSGKSFWGTYDAKSLKTESGSKPSRPAR